MKTAKKDHPRTRGEKPLSSVTIATDVGSPPHTRGKVEAAVICNFSNRITPAHAGKSNTLSEFFKSCKDHPRTRGEKGFESLSFRFVNGSPPHTRGKDAPRKNKKHFNGITPAHAGKSLTSSIFPDVWTDHPRTRGEK